MKEIRLQIVDKKTGEPVELDISKIWKETGGHPNGTYIPNAKGEAQLFIWGHAEHEIKIEGV